MYVDKARLEGRQPGGFDGLVKGLLDIGDIVGASGSVRRTDKGELSVVADSLTVLTKSLLPLPDKWHGLADVEKRYRCGRAGGWAQRPRLVCCAVEAAAGRGRTCPGELLLQRPPRSGMLARLLLYTLTLSLSWPGVAPAPCPGRQRYLDMIVSEETRATMRARSVVISALRRALEGRGFLEVGGAWRAAHACVDALMRARARAPLHACRR